MEQAAEATIGRRSVNNAQRRFERMVNALASDLYRYAFMLCRNPTLAEDLVQETFMRAWRKLHTLRDERKVKSWLITTLRREYARGFERYQPQFDGVNVDELGAEPDSLERDAEVWELRRAVLGLPSKYREVLVLQVVGGYTGAEISALLELPLPTVNTRLFRARQKLRRDLTGEGGALTRGQRAIE